MAHSLACIVPDNEHPGSSPTQSKNLETPCDELVLCHNPLLIITLPFAYTACSKKN